MPDIRADIRARALMEGFDVVRFTTAGAAPQSGERLASFLAQERHGSMDWMQKHADRRSDPKTLWPEAKTVIVLGVNYGPRGDRFDKSIPTDRGTISVYAQGDDYHDVIKGKLKRFGHFIAEKYAADVKVFVDTAPVMEKPLAQTAGIGWQGKHTNLVSRLYGSWLFLGSLFTTLELSPDEAEVDHCGGCHRCLDVCPTDAFPAPYELDARRCISYLTIEHKGHIPSEFREPIGNRIYGCDDCLAVCPWNKFASLAQEIRLRARAELVQPKLVELAKLDDAEFREIFRGSPIKRIGRDRFVRNVLIAIGNSGDAQLAPEVEVLLGDPSALVRAMAVWALKRIAPERASARAPVHLADEADEDVRAEWSANAPVPPSAA
jgi:epoxyqueuosine reductase